MNELLTISERWLRDSHACENVPEFLKISKAALAAGTSTLNIKSIPLIGLLKLRGCICRDKGMNCRSQS